MNAAAEQQAQLADMQMPANSTPAADLKMIHAEVSLGQLKASLDRPA